MMEAHKALTNVAQSIANEEGRELIEETIIVRFREDPVGFIREVYPDTQLNEWQLEAIRIMARDPRTKLRKEGNEYVLVLPTDITREMDEALFGSPVVGSRSVWDVPESRVIEDVRRAAELAFQPRRIRPVEVPDPDEWVASCKPTDTSRQAFKRIANRRRGKR